MYKFLLVLVVALTASPVSAGIIIGPGDIQTGAGDQAFDLIAVDLNSPVTLGAGSYLASLFNYQFTDFAGYETTGTITPLLLTGSGTTFTPLAIGNPVAYDGETGFLSIPFSGIDTFTLGASTTVYAGLYWEASQLGDIELRMPVGYAGTGNTFVVYGGGTGPGADPPEIETPVSGSAEGFFTRSYDFSIEVDEQASVVPAPPSLVLSLTGFIALFGYGWFRRTGLV